MGEKSSLKDKAKKSFGKNFTTSIRKNKRILITVTIIFGLTIGITIFANQIGSNPINKLVESQTEPFRRMLANQSQKERTTIEWISFLTRNNITSTIQTIGLGITFGIFSLYSLLLNGLMIGYVTSQATISLQETLSLLLPHGVFELPGYVIATTCGIRLGIGSIKTIEKRTTNPLKKAGREIKNLIPSVILLIIIAAIIEGILGTKQTQILNSNTAQLGLIGVSIASFIVIVLWISGILTGTSPDSLKRP